MKLFIAIALMDDSEDGYTTICEEPFLTRKEAKDHLNGIRAHVKSIKEVGN